MKEKPELDPLSRDSQMTYIKELAWLNKDRIADAPSSIAEMTKVLYEHIEDYILDIVDRKYIGTGKVAILGGIQINVAHHDYFLPQMFKVMDSKGDHDFLPQLKEFDKVDPEDT